MTFKYVEVPLFSDTVYNYSINLEGNRWTFNWRWSETTSSWYYDIYDVDGNALVTGQRLISQYPMLLDYRLTRLSGHLVLLPNTSTLAIDKTEQGAIPEFFTLYYVYEE